MLPDLKGKGLFVFSDPGGAKPVLALITMLQTLKSYKIISDRVYPFFADFGLEVEQYLLGNEHDVFRDYKPDFLFTGTSYTSNVELKFVKEARENNVISYSFIDHYTKFEERFLMNGVYVFPDHICLIDEKAKAIGSQTDLPKDRFLVSGNFYHQWLREWTPSVSKDELFISLKIPLGNKLFVYAPDPLSNVGGVGKYGLDEISVFQDLVEAFNKVDNKNYTLLIKMHPNQNKDVFHQLVAQNDSRCIISDDTININTILYHSDLVIGIFSNILIESAIMNKKVLRCLIRFNCTDPLESNNVGLVVHNSKELSDVLALYFI